MRKLGLKLIRKYKEELDLGGWAIDIEFANVKNSLYCNVNKKEALIVIKKSKCKNQRKLNTIIKYQLIELKERIFKDKKK